MSKKIKLYRYYSANNLKNLPEDLTLQDLETGDFLETNTPIYLLGIQTLPGTKFILNLPQMPNEQVIVGYTGIFELELHDGIFVEAIKFDHNSLLTIEQNPNTYLIIDTIYEDGGDLE